MPTRPKRLIENLARRLEQQAPGVAASILEGLDEILTVIRLGLPADLRRSLACTNIIENMMGTIRPVRRDVESLAGRVDGTALDSAAMLEAAKGFRRLKAKATPGTAGSPRESTKPSMRGQRAVELAARAA